MVLFKKLLPSFVETSASAQAKRMGLTGDGHDWYDKQGKLIAKTVDGKLKVFGGGGAPKKEEDKTLKQRLRNLLRRKLPKKLHSKKQHLVLL